MYEIHPNFNELAEESKIWRYMDFTKFVHLLESESLFFTRADKFEDPFEGVSSMANQSLRNEIYNGKIPPEAFKLLDDFSKMARMYTFVNCWHLNDYEAAAMWKLYLQSNEGVAIQTNFQSLGGLWMRSNRLVDWFINKKKMKRLEHEIEEENSFELASTTYGEPVLMKVTENSESSLSILLLYTNGVKLYRATFLGSFKGDQMEIDDLKVLNEPSYSPKFKEPFRKGYGSLLMIRALEEAEKRGVKEVVGKRVSSNEKQKKRQLNYYSKFGFTMDSNDQLYKKL